MKKKSKKIIGLLIFGTVIFATIGIGVSLSPAQIISSDNTYILSNSIIKNFQFENFDGEKLSYKDEDGNYVLKTSAYDNKLKFEMGNTWNISKKDVELINAYEVGDEVKYFYKITMHNYLTAYTNVPVSEAVDHIEQNSYRGHAGSYRHKGSFGDVIAAKSWDSYFTYYYQDFYGSEYSVDDINEFREYNAQHNLWGGNLQMSFDINPSPLPSMFTSDGQNYSKNFDYIGVSSAGVESQANGLLSDTEPGFIVNTPENYDGEIEPGNYKTGGNRQEMEGYSNLWDPHYNLDLIGPYQWSEMQAGTTPGASLNPRNKDGSPTYDNTQQIQKSQAGCRIVYNIGRISPVVKFYEGKFSWEEQDIITYDKYICHDNFLGVPTDCEWVVREDSNRDVQRSVTRPAAVHVNNQYIRAGIQITFNVFTSYKNLETKETQEDTLESELPKENTEEQIWGLTVDGWGGGEQYTAAGWSMQEIANIILSAAIIIAIVAIILYVLYKLGFYQKAYSEIKGFFKN